MGILYRIDEQKGATFVVWDGVVTADDFIAHARRLISDLSWPTQRRIQLVDLLTASLDTSVDDATLQNVARIYAGQQDKLATTKVAVAASEIFMKAARFEELMSNRLESMIVFNSLETACMWLGIDPTEAREILQELRIQLRKGNNP